MGPSQSQPPIQKSYFCLVGALNSGKSTLININHLGHSQFTQSKSKIVQTSFGERQFIFTDTTGFSDQTAVGYSRIDQIKKKQNFIFLIDVNDDYSYEQFETSYGILVDQEKCPKPILVLGNQILKVQTTINKGNKIETKLMSQEIPSQKYLRLIQFCYQKGLYLEFADLKDRKSKGQVQRIYSVMEKRISISKFFHKNKYSISLLGQSKSGKSSLQSMLTASKKESNQIIVRDGITVTIGSRVVDIDIYKGPGFDFKKGRQLWRYIKDLVNKDIIIIVLDLSSQDCLKYLQEICEVIIRDFKSDFKKIIIIGNKKNQQHKIDFKEIRFIMEEKFQAKETRYIEINCKDASSNRQKLLHYIDQIYLTLQ